MSAFDYSAASYSDNLNVPAIQPGKLHDRTDNDAHSHLPEGGPAPYGRVLVVGRSAMAASGSHNVGDRFYTKNDTVSLPDRTGNHLTTPAGVTYATAGFSLPTVGGDFIIAGIGVWTEYNKPHSTQGRLTQPFGLGDKFFQERECGQVAVATQGNIWCYCETDIDKGDDLFYRVEVTSTTDGIQLLGALRNDDDAGRALPFPHGSVFVPGPAGGLFVLSLNLQK